MPRQAALGEHRNDHQLATAEKFGHIANLRVVHTDQQLHSAIEALLGTTAAVPCAAGGTENARQLIREVRNFVLGDVTWTMPEAANWRGAPDLQRG